MIIKDNALILSRTDFEHVMDGFPMERAKEIFQQALEDEKYLNGLEDAEYDKIEIRLQERNHR